MCPVDLFIDTTLTEVMKVSFFASDKSTTSSCVTDKEEFTSELIQIHKPHLWVFQDNSHQSGPWPGPAGVSGPPAGRGWAPSPHRWGSPEQWRWGCAARWRDKGGPLLHEWSGITCCRDERDERDERDDVWFMITSVSDHLWFKAAKVLQAQVHSATTPHLEISLLKTLILFPD